MASGKIPHTGDGSGFTLKVQISSYNAQTESIGSTGNVLNVFLEWPHLAHDITLVWVKSCTTYRPICALLRSAVTLIQDSDDFWPYLALGNGNWMWDQLKCPLGIDVVVEALAMGMAILVTDGSYNRKVDSRVCGAGWVVHCTKLNKTVLEGSFYYTGDGAGSYRVQRRTLGLTGNTRVPVQTGEILRF